MADGTADAQALNRWSEAGFGRPKATELQVTDIYGEGDSSKGFRHRLRLLAVVLRQTGWTREEVTRRIQRIAQVYAQCEITVARATVVEADAPNGWRDLDGALPDESGVADQLSELLPTSARPVIVYLRSNQGGAPATSFPADLQSPFPHVTGTAWVTFEVSTPAYRKARDSSYSPDAHELAHLLIDSSHLSGSDRNLMANASERVNDRLTPEQCATMRASPLVKSLTGK